MSSSLYPQRSLEQLETRICFAATPGATPPPPITVLADVNADGKADLISLYAQAPSSPAPAANTAPTPPKWELKIQLGNGDGTFSPGTETTSPAQHPVAIAVGDLDGDGKPDLAILDRDPAPQQTTTTPRSTTPAPAAPHESIFLLKTDGRGAVLPPPSTATAAPKPLALPDGLDASSIAATDLNKDGLQDLVAIGTLLPKPAATTHTQPPKPVVNVATLLNTKAAKGTFQKPALTATDAAPGAYQLATAGDLDKNGSPDLVAFQVAPPPPPPGQQPPAPKTTTTTTTAPQQPPKNLALVFSNGDGTLRVKSQANPLLPPPPTSSSSSSQQQQQPPPVITIGVTDIDGDGAADLIGASATSVLVSRFDPKTLTFQAPKPAASANTPPAHLSATHLLLGDVNGDGEADLLSATDKAVTLGLNTSTLGTPTFSWSPIAPPTKAS